MKYLALIWSGIWRKRGRTWLMLLQIFAAFLLFGLLQGVKSGIDQAVQEVQADLYWVQPAEAGTTLPLALEQRIAAVPGVKRVYPESVFPATYQRPTQQLGVLGTNFDAGWANEMDTRTAPEAIAALARTRTGTLVSSLLAERYHWKVGDRLPLLSQTAQQDGSTSWNFQIVGIFRSPADGALDNWIIIRSDYFDEARQRDRGTTNQYILQIADVNHGQQLAQRIDALTANSPFETRTQSIRAVTQSNLQNLGDLNFIVHSIVGAALFALLIATAAMTMQSVRERTIELAVLKTVGFSDRRVFVLLLLESLTLSVGAAVLGLVVAERIVPLVHRFIGLRLTMPRTVFGSGLVLALILALVSAVPPGWRALRLQVAEALAGR